MPKLARKTKRLHIRVLESKDFKAWRQSHLEQLPIRNPWDRGGKTQSELTRAKFLDLLKAHSEQRRSDLFYTFAAIEKSSGQIVGLVSIMDVQRSLAQSAYLGYSINNNHWGKGYGKEAVTAVMDIAFKELKLHRLEAGVEPSNRRSIMLARSLGLRKEGLKKRMLYFRDKWVDIVMYSATCEDLGIKWKGTAQRTRPRV
jgi:ribosomal-protein-alanine N-acetyltransferase